MLQFCAAVCSLSLAGIEQGDEDANVQFHGKNKRPTVKAKINEKAVQCLVDSGASISVVAEDALRSIWSHWNMFRLPMPSALRVTGITGHRIQVVDYVLVEMEILGRTIRRPMLVVSGLDHTQVVLGWDTIMEEGLVVDGMKESVYFRERKQSATWSVAELRLTRRQRIEPRSIQRVEAVAVCETTVLPPGATGICEAIPGEKLGLWDCIAEVNGKHEVTIALANPSEATYNMEAGDCIGTIRNMEHFGEEARPLDEECIASIFGQIGIDPKPPKHGLITKLNETDRTKLVERIRLEAPAEWKQQYLDLILRYHDVLSRNKFDLGWTEVIQHRINMKDQTPIHCRQFRVPFEHEAMLHEYIDELLKKGAIEVSRSPYNSAVFCVQKKALPDAPPDAPRPLRCVLDYRRINANSLPDRYCMREVRECIDEVGRRGSKIYTTVDLTSGFWQQALAEDSRQYTAFTVPGKGTRYQWRVTPMGLQGSPASFARLMDYIMRGAHGVLTYIDDVLVHSVGHGEHLRHLEEVLWRLRRYGLKMNVEKTTFAATTVQYLGYTLQPDGITLSKDKLQAIQGFPAPTTTKKVREFLGVANYFRFLIPGFARVAAPLNALTSKNCTWAKGPLPKEAQAAFQQLKKLLTSEPVVAHPRRGKPFILHTDGALGDADNPGGLGAVLSQLDEHGKERVIAYASRSLRKHERNYSAFLLEVTAAVFGIEHFDTYLLGKRFTLYTDHKPMEKLSEVHKKTLNRLQQLMMEYDFTLCYKRGEENSVADFLSRNAVVGALSDLTDEEQSVEVEQRLDERLQGVVNFLQTRQLPADKKQAAWTKRIADLCFMDNGLLWYKSQRPGFRDRVLLVAPRHMSDRIIQAAHLTREAGHAGKEKTAERIMLSYWWPGIHSDVEEWIRGCERCMVVSTKQPPRAPLQSLPICTGPNERIHIDLVTMLRTAASGRKNICVMTDAFTKYAEVVAIEDKEADTVARVFFERWICRFSVPEMMVSDKGKEFDNKVMDELCKIWGTRRIRTTAYHPETNAQVERYNRTMIKYFKSMLDNDQTLEWEDMLPTLQLAYNSHVHRSTRETPFYLTFLHDPRLPWFDISKPKQYYSYSYGACAFQRAAKAFQMVRENMGDAKEAREEYYDRLTKDRVFQPGDRVLVYFDKVPERINAKFFKKWSFFTVLKKVGPVNVLVRATIKSKPILVHVNRVKHASEAEIQEACDSVLTPYVEQDLECTDEQTDPHLSRAQRNRSTVEFQFGESAGSAPRDRTRDQRHDPDRAGGETHTQRQTDEGTSEHSFRSASEHFEDADEIFEDLRPVPPQQWRGPDQRSSGSSEAADSDSPYEAVSSPDPDVSFKENRAPSWTDTWAQVARNWWPGVTPTQHGEGGNTRPHGRGQATPTGSHGDRADGDACVWHAPPAGRGAGFRAPVCGPSCQDRGSRQAERDGTATDGGGRLGSPDTDEAPSGSSSCGPTFSGGVGHHGSSVGRGRSAFPSTTLSPGRSTTTRRLEPTAAGGGAAAAHAATAPTWDSDSSRDDEGEDGEEAAGGRGDASASQPMAAGAATGARTRASRRADEALAGDKPGNKVYVPPFPPEYARRTRGRRGNQDRH